jgi:hypothetical protein
MCISVRFCARAGWTPALACKNCALAKAIRAREVQLRKAETASVSAPRGMAAFLRDLSETVGLRVH